MMNRAEFMNELKDRLKRLPYEEAQNAVNYYEEYFNDAGPQHEEATITALGSPAAVASKIIGEYAVTAVQPIDAPPKEKKTNVLLIAILAVFASPIALPLAIAVLGVILGLGATFFALFLSGAAMVIAGLATIVFGFWAFTTGFATGLFYLGAGLLTIAIGAATALGIGQLSRLTFRGLVKWLGKLLIRRGTA